MFKELLKEKKGIALVAGIVIVALFVTFLYVFASPRSDVAANEDFSIAPEQQAVLAAESVPAGPEHNEDESPALTEMEPSTDSSIQEDIEEETYDATDEDTGKNNEDEFGGKEDGENPPKYIGRQPPEGYVEPEALEYRGQWQRDYKDTYQSNIVVILDDLFETDHTDYAWFHPTSDNPPDAYAEIFDFVAYAILTYYDGDVPCDYSFYLQEDCHNMHPNSTKIFEIQTHGDRPLNICLDFYNYKIYVEEGIVERGLSWAEEHGG